MLLKLYIQFVNVVFLKSLYNYILIKHNNTMLLAKHLRPFLTHKATTFFKLVSSMASSKHKKDLYCIVAIW